MPYLLFLKKQQNLKLSSAANYRWRFKGYRTDQVAFFFEKISMKMLPQKKCLSLYDSVRPAEIG